MLKSHKSHLISVIILLAASAQAQENTIQASPDLPSHRISTYLTGACLEDVNHEVYGGIYSQMIFGESFQEPAPSLPLAGFTGYGGNWQVQNDGLWAAGGSGPKLVHDSASLTTGEASVDLLFSSNAGGNAGMIVKVSEPGVGADVFNGYEVSLSPAGSLVLGRHRQNWEPLSQVACPVPVNQWITLRVVMSGASMEIFVCGTSVLQYTDTQFPLAGGQIGLRTWQQDTSFRNFSIITNGVAQSIAFNVLNNAWGSGLSSMWSPLRSGTANGQFSVETAHTFVGAQSQRMTFTGGVGEVALANQGLNHWGMFFAGGQNYEGCLYARADSPTTLSVALESNDGTTVFAEQNLTVTSNDWQRLDFNLTPSATNNGGCFAIKLKQPGSVVIGYAFLQSGDWGRFQGLPVRKDVVQGLIDQGITVLRYGGTMINASGYRWTNMIGLRAQRPTYQGFWYQYATDGWGIFDFLNLCDAAGFLGIPAVNMGESAQDMANFVQYVNGATNTLWGARRAADGHPQPYGLKYLEMGNEERIDDNYYQKFQTLAPAIWAQDPNLILVVGEFAYEQTISDPFNFSGAGSGITSLSTHQKILQLAKQNNREVWFDVHVWTDGPTPTSSLSGMLSFDTALGQIANGAAYKVVVFELNANNHSQRRAIANALALNAIQRDGRLPIVISANCLQPDGENDNGWNQGLLFLNPSKVWLQPPGYVTRMMANHFQPLRVPATVQGANNLDVCVRRSDDGQTLVLQVVNLSDSSALTTLRLDKFVPTNSIATVEALAGSLDAVNTAGNPQFIVPTQSQWQHGYTNGVAHYTFAPNSFSVITFQGKMTLPAPVPAAALKHRWSFNEPAGATSFVDSVLGMTNGIVHGAANLDGKGNLVLPGLSQNNNYAELPPYLLTASNYSAVTFEFWVNFGTNPNWGRLIDFGDTNPDTGFGRYCLDFTPHSGFSPNGVNFEVSGTDPGFNSTQNIATGPILDNCGKLHLILEWDSIAGTMAIYTNGVLMAINTNAALPMSAIVNAHSYLGKSSYSGDSCGVATIDEFRMYSGTMGTAQIAADLSAGPNELPRPGLTFASNGQNVVFTWAGYDPGYGLETSAELGPRVSWVPVQGSPAFVVTNGTFSITLPMNGQQAFYRLVKVN